jgi:hypothetical protein
MEDLKKLKVKNWRKTAKDRRTWRELAEKAKTHKGLSCQMMVIHCSIRFVPHCGHFAFFKKYFKSTLL